jgi:hypothetical protein
MPIQKTLPRMPVEIDRDEIKKKLEYQKKNLYAEKMFKDFKSRLLIVELAD